MIYRKLYMDKILPYVDTPFIKILTGVRRCGKSTILNMLQDDLMHKGVDKKQILCYRFDSLQYEEIKTASRLYNEVKQNLANGKNTSPTLFLKIRY